VRLGNAICIAQEVVKGVGESMSAWVGCVKSMSFHLEDIRVDVSDENTILQL
jgi:hypothetical protein